MIYKYLLSEKNFKPFTIQHTSFLFKLTHLSFCFHTDESHLWNDGFDVVNI